MLEAAEAVAAALDLLDAQVQAFRWSVAGAGGVVGQDLVAPGPQRVAETDDLGHVVGEAAGDRLVEQGAGVSRCAGEVDVAHRLLGQPGAQQLVVGIADAQAEQDPLMASFIQPFSAGEEQLADPIERIAFAAPVAERLVLDPAADLVDATVGDPHHMERIRDAGNELDENFRRKLQEVSRELQQDCAEPTSILLIGEDESSPLTIIEGNHRVAAALLVSPRSLPERFRVLCGLSPRMTECCWYRTSLANLLRYARNKARDLARNRDGDVDRLLKLQPRTPAVSS